MRVARALALLSPLILGCPEKMEVSEPARDVHGEGAFACSTESWTLLVEELGSRGLAGGAVDPEAPFAACPAARYRQAFGLWRDGRTQRALATFLSLPLEEVPASLLYAPHRLHRELRPNATSPFRARLSRAAERGQLPELLRARLWAEEGRPGESLSAYLRTDPGRWVKLDVERIARNALHAGFEGEARRLAESALRSGRCSPEVEERLRDVLSGQAVELAALNAQASLAKAMREDPGARALAISAATDLLKTRRHFLDREYERIVSARRESDAVLQSTEVALLTFLAALKLGDAPEAQRWGEELKRRHPGAETVGWVHRLKRESTHP